MSNRPTLQRWLFTQALPVWASLGIDHHTGGFYDSIDSSGHSPTNLSRGRVQARQVYSFATAGLMGWPGPWKRIVEGGLDYIFKHQMSPDGLLLSLTWHSDPAKSPDATLYDQAFFLLALQSANAVLPNQPNIHAAALNVVSLLHRTYRITGSPGYREITPPFYQSNPHMHLLEAALAWESISGNSLWSGLADEIVALCCANFLLPESGAIAEFFNDNWMPLSFSNGQRVEPGHQFEWSWLLGTWARRRERPDVMSVSKGLYQLGLKHGICSSTRTVINGLEHNMTANPEGGRLWPQTEWIKAENFHSRATRVTHLSYQPVPDSVLALEKYLSVTSPGLWLDRLDETHGTPAPASSLYHIVCAASVLVGATQPIETS